MNNLTSEEQLINALDDVLPQTQCGLCDYGGCRPYAEAIVKNHEEINRCPPGGLLTLQALAKITQQDSSKYTDEMLLKAKTPSRAVIREDECIGCTKCIQACPVDAILGSGKKMHTVIAQECTGCELCIEPCPVDCIDMLPVNERLPSEQTELSRYWRNRYEFREQRQQSHTESATATRADQIALRQHSIQLALERTRNK